MGKRLNIDDCMNTKNVSYKIYPNFYKYQFMKKPPQLFSPSYFSQTINLTNNIRIAFRKPVEIKYYDELIVMSELPIVKFRNC